MILQVTDATAIFLMTICTIIIIILCIFFFRRIKNERIRYKEERSIKIEGVVSYHTITSQINSYINRITTNDNFSLLLLEIQDFEKLVKAFGVVEAERTLEKAIFRVMQIIPKRIVVGSLGRTKYLLFLKSEYDRFYAIELAKKIIANINKPVKIFQDTNINFNCNIGICFFPMHGVKLKQLMNSLNIALHDAVKAGLNKYAIYLQNAKDSPSSHIEYHYEIKEAIEKKEFIMQYQPIVNLDNQELYGIEAFVRWKHPKHGILSPVQFLNIMEQSGDISWIGCWGLETIIKDYQKIKSENPNLDIAITFSLSPKQLIDNEIATKFSKILKKYKIKPEKIYLKIQEYATYERNSTIKGNLLKLKRIGFKIAVNGFGIDFSKIMELDALPIDAIRLDKYFFENEKANELQIKNKLTSLIVDFANNNEKEVIAESVENVETLEMVKSIGIKLIQGYAISMPLMADELSKFIKNKDWEKLFRKTIDEENFDY